MGIKNILKKIILIIFIVQPALVKASFAWNFITNATTNMILNVASSYLPSAVTTSINAYQTINMLCNNPITNYCINNISIPTSISSGLATTAKTLSLRNGNNIIQTIGPPIAMLAMISSMAHGAQKSINKTIQKTNNKPLNKGEKNISYEKFIKNIDTNYKPTKKEFDTFTSYKKEQEIKSLDLKNQEETF